MPGIAVSPGVAPTSSTAVIIDVTTSLNLKQHNNHFNGLLKFVHCTDQLSSVLYLGFHKGGGGGANFRWPLVLTQRRQTKFSYFFKGGHCPPLKYATGSADISVLSHIIDCRKTFLSSAPAFHACASTRSWDCSSMLAGCL